MNAAVGVDASIRGGACDRCGITSRASGGRRRHGYAAVNSEHFQVGHSLQRRVAEVAGAATLQVAAAVVEVFGRRNAVVGFAEPERKARWVCCDGTAGRVGVRNGAGRGYRGGLGAGRNCGVYRDSAKTEAGDAGDFGRMWLHGVLHKKVTISPG